MSTRTTLGEAASALAPVSPQAEAIAALSWWMFAAGALLLVLVTVLAVLAVLRSRRGPRPVDQRSGLRFVLGAGVVLPVVALTILLVASLAMGRGSLRKPPRDALTVQVRGHQWWWEAHYLDADGRRVASVANELHVPVGRPVRVLLEAQDVIHSFWAPNLHGKTDMIPGRTNAAWFRVDRAGTYKGACAEFCGEQHAAMAFLVVAQPPEQFANWLAAQGRAAAAPADVLAQQGRQVFDARGCVLCHAARGTVAGGLAAPDLTHVASRQTLAAGRIPNNRGSLAAWILDPQHVKRGTRMPATALSAAELHALLHYLEGLHGGLQRPAATSTTPVSARTLMRDNGCIHCHTIGEIPGANGRVGPPLTDFDRRRMIAGRHPNTFDNLVRFLLDPQAMSPGSAMPKALASEQEARAVAAYLLRLEPPGEPPPPRSPAGGPVPVTPEAGR